MSAAATKRRPTRRRFTRIFGSRNYTVLPEQYARDGLPQLRRFAAIDIELGATDLLAALPQITPEPGIRVIDGVCVIAETKAERQARIATDSRECAMRRRDWPNRFRIDLGGRYSTDSSSELVAA